MALVAQVALVALALAGCSVKAHDQPGTTVSSPAVTTPAPDGSHQTASSPPPAGSRARTPHAARTAPPAGAAARPPDPGTPTSASGTPSAALPSATTLPAALPVAGADGTGALPSAAAVAAAVAQPLSDAGLGPAGGVHALVLDAATGAELLDTGGGDPSPPASTVKIATAAAALTVLGPQTRLATTVLGPAPVAGQVTGDLILVGAGDPTLTTATAGLAGRVSVAGLAAALVRAGVTRVSGSVLGDGRLFTGPATAPGWQPGYVTDGSVAPVSALEVDGGRYSPSREPAPRVPSPTTTAAVDLTAALRLDHVTVSGEGATLRTGPPGGDVVLASLSGPPVVTLVRQMLTYSDNDLAECLGRLVSLSRRGPASFAGAAAAVTAAGFEVDSAAGYVLGGAVLADASGLSRRDRVAPGALAAIVRATVLGGHPELRAIASGLPVAGRSGTLRDRYLSAPAKAAAGKVHAKTGALAGVSTEDGWLTDRDGRVLIFAFGSDDTASRPAAEAALDRGAAALVGLGAVRRTTLGM